MVDDLADHALDEVLEVTKVLLSGLRLHPGDPSPTLGRAARICEWAERHGVVRVADLTGDVAAAMLRDLTGVEHLARFHPPATADLLHQTRNTLIALRGITLIARSNHTSKRQHRPAGDTLAAGLPRVADRTQRRGRPLRGDEIKLGRILVEIDLMEGAPFVPIHAYLLAETGLGSMEISKVERDHLDDPYNPTQVTAAGLWKAGPRVVKLDPFVANVFARTLPRLRLDGNQLLAYTGQNTGKAASASIIPTLNRYLDRAGVTGTDISAKSINLWRPDHLLRAGKLKKAVRVHGRSPADLLNDLGYTVDPASRHKKKTRVFDDHHQPVAAVSSWHLSAA